MKLSNFLSIIQESVNSASKALNKSSEELIKEYFYEAKDSDGNDILKPKVKTFEYQAIGENDVVQTQKVEIPLITLVPHTSTPKIKEAKFSCKFEIEDKNGDVEINFLKNKVFSKDDSTCTLDLTIVPEKLPNGLDSMIDILSNNIDIRA